MLVGVPAAEAVDTDIAIDTTTLNFGQTNVGNTIRPDVGHVDQHRRGPLRSDQHIRRCPADRGVQHVAELPGHDAPRRWVVQRQLHFSPLSPGLFTDTSAFTISETANQSDGEDFSVSLAGVGVNPITAVPLSHNFGSVIVGTTSPPMTTVITNTSTANFGPINIFGGAPPTAEFNASQNCQGTTLPAGGSCNVNYTFSPTAPGVFNDVSAFTISATASQAAGVDFSVALTGCGAVVGGQCPLPDVTLNPGSLSVTLAPNQSNVQSFAIGNVGGAPLNWTIAENNATTGACVALDIPWASALPAGGSTAPGGASNVDVTFNSTGLAPGTCTAAVCRQQRSR